MGVPSRGVEEGFVSPIKEISMGFRRSALKTGRWVYAVCAIALFLGAVGCDRIADRVIETAAQRRADAGTQTELLENDAMDIFLCGTGSPLPDASSASACTPPR